MPLTRRREVRLTQTEVDVRRADRLRQLLQQEQFFDRAVRAAKRGQRICAVVALDALQTLDHIVERGLPVGLDPLAALLRAWAASDVRGCSAPSYEKRSLSEIQHSLIASFSNGRTRITRLFFTCTTRLAPTESCGLTDLRRDSSHVRAL